MKKIAVIGATGFVGKSVLKELVERGYIVTAIARDVQALKNSEHVVAVQADVNDVTALAAAIKGTDAVVSTFNAGWDNPNIYEDFIRGCRSILEAVKEAGVRRIIVVGGAGSLEIDGKRLVDDPNFPKEIKEGALAAADFLEVIKREQELDWTFVSPAIEMNQKTSGKRTGSYRTALNTPVFDGAGKSRLSVEDLAVAIVDEIESGQFIKKRFTAGY